MILSHTRWKNETYNTKTAIMTLYKIDHSSIILPQKKKSSWQYNIACNTKIWVPQQMLQSGCLYSIYTTILYVHNAIIAWNYGRKKKKNCISNMTNRQTLFLLSYYIIYFVFIYVYKAVVHERGKGKRAHRVSSTNKTKIYLYHNQHRQND